MTDAIDHSSPAVDQQHNRMQMLKDFDNTKAGVKGHNDSGLLKLPEIFVRPSEEVIEDLKHEKARVQVPVIDLSEVSKGGVGRKLIVEQVRNASEKW